MNSFEDISPLESRLGFIGGGQMAEALIKGLLSKGVLKSGQISCADPSDERRVHMRNAFNVAVSRSNRDVVKKCDVLLLAVKPQIMGLVLEDIRDQVIRDHLVVSIAAGVTLKSLEEVLSPGVRVIRVMPNTPALVQHGASVLCPGKTAGKADLDLARKIFQAVGTAVVVTNEELMDAVTGLSGSGPAYVFSFIQGLIDAGVREGLPRPLASGLAVQTVLGAAAMCARTGKDPSQLTSMVTSPGGTTIEGLYALEKGGLRGVIMDAVHRATARSRELGK